MMKEYIVTNAINGIEQYFDYLLGDVIDAGIENIIGQFMGALSVMGTTGNLAATAAAFKTLWAADYLVGGVIVTASGITVVFTSSVAGTAFTGATAIANVSGTLAGSVVNTQANVTALTQIDTVTLTGTDGGATITCSGVAKVAVWNTSLTQTAADFVTDFAADYLAAGVVCTSSGADVIFTASVAGTPFAGATDISNEYGTLFGSIVNTQANRVAVAQIDTVTLATPPGTANITCDAVTKLATTVYNQEPTAVWNTRAPGGEADPLLELIGGELGYQFSRPKQILQLPVQETDNVNTNPHVNVIGTFYDNLNLDGDNNARIFAFNRGLFDVKNRSWDLDLIEIIHD
jgi:hypothetical protein